MEMKKFDLTNKQELASLIDHWAKSHPVAWSQTICSDEYLRVQLHLDEKHCVAQNGNSLKIKIELGILRTNDQDLLVQQLEKMFDFAQGDCLDAVWKQWHQQKHSGSHNLVIVIDNYEHHQVDEQMKVEYYLLTNDRQVWWEWKNYLYDQNNQLYCQPLNKIDQINFLDLNRKKNAFLD